MLWRVFSGVCREIERKQRTTDDEMSALVVNTETAIIILVFLLSTTPIIITTVSSLCPNSSTRCFNRIGDKKLEDTEANTLDDNTPSL